MKKLVNIKVIEDLSNNKFGVEGYEVELSTNLHSIPAFINNKNIISVNTGVSLSGLFKSTPFTSEFIEKVEYAMNNSLVSWTPEVKLVEVDLV